MLYRIFIQKGDTAMFLYHNASTQPPSPLQLTLCDRYGILECEGQANKDVGEGPSRGLPRKSWSVPRIITASVKKKWRVIVIGDSLQKGIEGTIC